MIAAAHRSATELCRVLLDNFFGPAVADVGDVLLSYGRSEAVTISRKAGLSPKLTRQSLAVMIQHSLVQFSIVSDVGHERTYYECNWRQILVLLHTGKIMWWAGKEVSQEAAALLKYVSIYGKAKAGDIASAFASQGSDTENVREKTEFNSILVQLMQKKVLRIAALHESKPVEDFKQSIRNEEMRSLNGLAMPESRKVKEVEERMQRRLREIQDLADRPDHGLKRKADGQENGRMRKKLRTEDDDDRPTIDPSIMLGVNHEKYQVFQRNEDLGALCQKRLGPTPGTVYRLILKELEPRIHSCRQDTSDIVITTLTISRALPRDLDLSSIWATESGKAAKDGRNGSTTKKQTKLKTKRERSESEIESEADTDDAENESDADSFIMKDDDDEELASEDDSYAEHDINKPSGDRIKNVNRLCDLFAADSLRFLRKIGSRSMGEWQVDFTALSESLRQLELESMIQQKFGDLAPRLLRIVKEKVKIDEKQLSTIALLKQKDIRHILTSLHEAGVLDLQEVPKRLDRQPSMTFFLWFHNPERAYASLAQDLCKAISRIHQRLKHELQERQRLLDKSQRTDVRNKESEYLSKQELLELRKIRSVEERLLAQSARLANSYAILTEF